MPWELGLAHGVIGIGRVKLWPFTDKALQAKSTQEYLHLYEALDPGTAKTRLAQIVEEARSEPYRPADLKMMEELAKITAAKLPEFYKPPVATEFTSFGPAELQAEWLRALSIGLTKKSNEL